MAVAPATADAPALLIGEFQDDYKGRHSISRSLWAHGSSKYHIVRWVPDQQYLVARNDSSNTHAPGKWTRIDWLPLAGMPPYDWAFCLSAYEAATEAIAAATTIAKRDTPRTGCNGFPFSRMQRAN